MLQQITSTTNKQPLPKRLWAWAVVIFMLFFKLVIVPLILVLKGHQTYSFSYSNFTTGDKLQKYQELMTVLIHIVISMCIFSISTYIVLSDKPKSVMEDIIDNNERINEYFGKITDKDYTTYKSATTTDDRNSVVNAKFYVTGTRRNGRVILDMEIQNSFAFMKKLDIQQANGEIINIINAYVTLSLSPFKYKRIEVLEELFSAIEDYPEARFLQITRSKPLRDFMRVTIHNSNRGDYYVVKYSQSVDNRSQTFRASGYITNQEYVLKLLRSYATGSDEFKKKAKWIKCS